MEKLFATNSEDLEYPEDQIEAARAELLSLYNAVPDDDSVLAQLKRKLKADEESPGINSQPFVVDYNNTIDSFGHIISCVDSNTLNHHDFTGNKFHESQFLQHSGCDTTNGVTTYDLHSTDFPGGTDKLQCRGNQNYHDYGNPNGKTYVYPKHQFNERFGKVPSCDRFRKVNGNNKKFTLDNRTKMLNQNGGLQTGTCKNGANCEEIGPSQAKLLRPMKVNFLSCDLCDYSVLENSQMLSHLKCNQHFSASLVEGSFQDGKFLPERVAKESYLLNMESKYKEIVPICLNCDNIFPTIYMCAMHFQIHHDKHVTDKYTVAMVTEEKSIIISVHNFTCDICKIGHMTETALLNHWIKNGHAPYQNPDSDTIVYFFCEYCPETRPFYNFSDAYKHVLKSHHREHIGGDVYLRVRYMKRSSVGERCVLLRSQMSIKKQFECDMKILNMMIQPFNRCDTEKQNKVTKSYLDELRTKYFSIWQRTVLDNPRKM